MISNDVGSFHLQTSAFIMVQMTSGRLIESSLFVVFCFSETLRSVMSLFHTNKTSRQSMIIT